MFHDLRSFIDAADTAGELKLVNHASRNLEIGAITKLMADAGNSPVLLFDQIDDYPRGYRVVTNMYANQRRTALGLGLPPEAQGVNLVRALRQKIGGGVEPLEPVNVPDGPVKENLLTGADVDLSKFPVPLWNELDGGPYIGTGCACIMRDPDDGWVNVGTYRVQVQDRDTVTAYLVPGHHGDTIARKYWARGLNCPIAISCGQEPLLWAASAWDGIPWGVSEYDFAGGLKGEPVIVTGGVTTDLPLPATAEIVLEGEILPPEVETRDEGPFGEWAGYYAGGVRPSPAIKIKAILHRDNPIIQGNPPSRLPSVWTIGRHLQKAVSLWGELDRNFPGVKGVWLIEDASIHAIPVISLKQAYAGHARAVGFFAANCGNKSFFSRMIIVVDEDIDPANLSQVMWALGTRLDPETSIGILTGMRGGESDPMLSPAKRRQGVIEMSKSVVVACKPYSWIKDFPPSVGISPELDAKMRLKWAELLD